MRPEARQTWWALAAWTALLLVVCARVGVVESRRNSVYPIFADAGRAWRASAGLYLLPESAAGKTEFRYSPGVAACFAPFTLLPDHASDMLWRTINVLALLFAVVSWHATFAAPGRGNDLGLRLGLLLPLAVGNVNNGQSNPLILALMLLGLTAAARESLAWAAGCCAVAVLFKVYPFALGLLLALVLPKRFLAWLLLFLAVGVVLPFAVGDSGYVAVQYGDWLRYLRRDDRSAWSLADGYRDLRLLLSAWAIRPNDAIYVALQLLGALACAGGMLVTQWLGWPLRRTLSLALGLGVCWMTLLGPCTESSTYLLLGPTLIAVLLEAESVRVRGVLVAAYGLLLVAGMASWFPGGTAMVHPWGLQPLAAVLCLAGLVGNEVRKMREGRMTILPSPRTIQVDRCRSAVLPTRPEGSRQQAGRVC